MPPKEWQQRIHEILAAIESIQRYTAEVTFDEFAADRRTVEAVAYNFAVIGEAAGLVPEDVRSLHPTVPWRSMRAMRNVVVHQYWGLDEEVLWDTCRHDLPPLVPLLRALTST